MQTSDRVVIDYTNWRGERAERTIEPKPFGIWFGSTEWHNSEQWLLDAIDLKSGEERTFAMKDIHSWKPVI